MFSYAGKLLFIDLTTSTIKTEDLSEEMADLYLGGYGIGAKILLERMPAHADAFSEESMLGIICGGQNATNAGIMGRYTVVHKSPVTQGFNDANSGGFFGNELKKAGFDGIFVSGIAPKPVYIWINDGKVELRNAEAFWGLDCKDIWDALRKDTGEPKLRYAAIGPAGENLNLYSCIINDGHRAAGRGGCGAVMGSKNLKAIAVRGTQKIEVADKSKITELNRAVTKIIRESKPHEYPNFFSRLGSTSETANSALSGDSPVKNWGGVGIRDFGEENAEKVNPRRFDDIYKVRKYSCGSCLIGCGAEYEVTDGRWPIGITDRPEYETLAVFGCNCMNAELDAIFKCNEICNRAGMDVISCGSTIAWAMECYENGILTADELDGLEANWGNAETMVALTQKIADNEGVGKILALGQQGAAEAMGKGHEYVMTCMGIEPPMHDGRRAQGYARMYQFDPTPGRHVKGGQRAVAVDNPEKTNFDFTQKMPYFKMSNVNKLAYQEVMNAAGMCMFSNFIIPDNWLNDQIEAVTGKEFSPEKLYYTGLRLFMLRHAFNIREGLIRKHFTMSPRLLGNPPMDTGPFEGVTVPNEKYGDIFFEQMGCDVETGIPKKETLERIGGLQDVIDIIDGIELAV